MNNLLIIKIYGWSFVVLGILFYFLMVSSGLNRGRVGELGQFGYFMFPIVFVLFSSYIGAGLVGFKKRVIRECYWLSFIGIVFGILLLTSASDSEKLPGLGLLLFSGSLIYFLRQPVIKENFK